MRININTKNSLIGLLIGAVVLGAITNVPADKIHPDMDKTVGIEDVRDRCEDQLFWDDSNV